MATYKQILAMDEKQWLSLSEQEMRKATKILVDVAAKRIKRLEAVADVEGSSPALASVDRGGKFTTKGKNLNQLRQEFIRVKGFLQAESSTVKGFKKIKKEIKKKLKQHGIELTVKNYKKFFNIYRKYAEFDKMVNKDNEFKYSIMREIAEYIDDGYTSKDIMQKLEDNYNERYEEYKEQQSNDDFSTSQFFSE